MASGIPSLTARDRFVVAEKARLQHREVYRADAGEASAAGSVFLLRRLQRNRFRLKHFRSGILVAHDLFRKTGFHPRIKSEDKLFRIML